MSKYEPLKAFLAESVSSEIPMRFSEIEQVIGAPLPPVAFKQRAWWSNNPTNSVITRAWLRAGYKTERVDMSSERLVFRRVASPESASPIPASTRAEPSGDMLERLWSRLGGTVRVTVGVDLTAPTGERWDAERQ